jgi:PKD domain
VVRRWLPLVFACALALALAPSASAQETLSPPDYAFQHDSSRDGTPNEVHSGFYPGDDQDNSNGSPLDDRYDDTYEYFYFTPDSNNYGSFTVNVSWGDPRIDFDLYVYRVRPDGGIVAASVASSASGGTTEENATYTPRNIGDPVEQDKYLIVVDNWCSRDADDDPTSDDPAVTADCGIGEDIPDEDDFTGSVSFGPREAQNTLPTATLSGPDTGRTGEILNFTAQGTDNGGAITNYKFDLNGDGFFETNTLTGNAASTSFSNPGTYNVGVQVTDNAGDTGFASKAVTISGPPGQPKPAALKPLRSFKLGFPAFGGKKHRKLVIRYRLRERGKVTLRLYRGKKRVRTLASNRSTRPNKTYRLTVRSKSLKRGRYTVRIIVRATSGKVQRAKLASKRV